MIEVRGKRVLVVGLARSGQAVALCLQRRGAVVTVTDIRPPSEFQSVLPSLFAQKIGVELGSQKTETFLRHELVVVSPGVPWDLPQLLAAREQRIPVLPEVEVASWFLDGTMVGITGSNGKTTTTSLLGKMLEASGFPTFVGGNIGVPLSTAVDRVAAGSILVTELSSFQLEGIEGFRPHIAVFLNLSPNHLDRHASFEAYAQAKRQIFRNQQADDIAVLNADDPAVAGLAPALASRKVFFSRQQEIPSGVFVANAQVLYRVGQLERLLFEKGEVALRGDFNLENVLAASAVACLLGADFEVIRTVVQEFRGVEHRLEFVQKIRGIEFYNNSKATSVDATAKSLEAFEGGVHLIMGGKDKGAPYAPLRPLLEERVRDVLVIGAAAERITQELSGTAEVVQAGDLATAVREAFQRGRPGEVVLLAPACSSFDQFHDFEHRGRVFKELVHKLAEEAEGREAGKAGATQARVSGFNPDLGPTALSQRQVPAGAAVDSTSPDHREGPPEAPLEAQRLAQSEPLCMYEVGAEGMPPGETEPPPSVTECLEPGSLEAVQDELMPFEYGRAAGASSSIGEGKRGESPSRPSSANPTNAESASPRSGEEKGGPASSRQSKLPGID
jgi:UDP-N-acetylmuramoylalanine--D-glutamate ligase